MMRGLILCCTVLSICFFGGCTPKVIVKKAGCDADQGIRYYRPKPYLFVGPGGETTITGEGETKKTTITQNSDEFVTIELQMLPDFSEEYAIDVRPGVGTANVNVTLQDGWMLTGLNQDLDSKVDENIKAAAELIKAGASIAPTGNKVGDSTTNLQAESATKKWVVRATNVPLGYYESVISMGRNGKKLAGWRYVGFAPFNGCSPEICDSGVYVDCNDPNYGPVYGLSFVQGVMTFRRLSDMQNQSPDPIRVAVDSETIQMGPVSKGGETIDLPRIAEKLKQDLEKEIGESGASSDVKLLNVEVVPNTNSEALDYDVNVIIEVKNIEVFNGIAKDLEKIVLNKFTDKARTKVNFKGPEVIDN